MSVNHITHPTPWKDGILGCFSDMPICCYGCWCTSCLFGDNAKMINIDGGYFVPCCSYCLTQAWCCCIVHKPARIRLRNAYELQEGYGLGNDFCATWCCSPCGVCQEAREIKIRGHPPTAVISGLPGTRITQP